MINTNSNEYVLGVDPGLSGGLALLDLKYQSSAHVFPMPTRKIAGGKSEVDSVRVEKILAEHLICLAVVERVHSFPHQGVASMFGFGKNYGRVLALIEAKLIPIEQPLPQRWKKEILRDTKKDKDAAVHYVKDRFPYLSLLATEKSKKPHDGIADAVCLAEFGRRLLLGKR